jgi:hypothetical protein
LISFYKNLDLKKIVFLTVFVVLYFFFPYIYHLSFPLLVCNSCSKCLIILFIVLTANFFSFPSLFSITRIIIYWGWHNRKLHIDNALIEIHFHKDLECWNLRPRFFKASLLVFHVIIFLLCPYLAFSLFLHIPCVSICPNVFL